MDDNWLETCTPEEFLEKVYVWLETSHSIEEMGRKIVLLQGRADNNADFSALCLYALVDHPVSHTLKFWDTPDAASLRQKGKDALRDWKAQETAE